MISAERAGTLLRVACSLVLVLCILAPAVREARAADNGPEVWLVTYGPGEIYWQRFGHNAIWIRDPGLGLDHTFNFGFFDFEQEDFFLRFLLGRMLYFSAAQPASVEFAQYIDEHRSIRAQRLNLTPAQALDLTEALVDQVQPGNRDYLYDYYLDNCSTRVRDFLDRAIGGRLEAASGDLPTPLTFRDHTRRSTETDFWLDLGLELVLGATVDRPISRWESFFIPALLADGIAQLGDGLPDGQPPLVVEDVQIHASDLPQPPRLPSRTWPRYLLAALGLLAAVAALTRWSGRLRAAQVAKAWLALGGMAGCAMLFFWAGTDHAVAADNLNLLLFNPLWLIVLAGRRSARPLAVLVWVCSAAALTAPALPPWQYTADVLAALLPLNVAAAWALFRPPGRALGDAR